jgi:hypothetical protein
VTQPGEMCYCDGRSMPPSLTDCTACLGLELFSCELLANPAAVADVLASNVQITFLEVFGGGGLRRFLSGRWERRRRGEACVNVVFEGELSRRQIMKEELINLVFKRYVIMWKKNCGDYFRE